MRKAGLSALGLALLVLLTASCRAAERPPPVPSKSAVSANGVRFQLTGNRLTVTVLPEAPAHINRMLHSELDFFCGKRDQLYPFAPVPRAERRFPVGARETSVVLEPADARLASVAAYCGMEGTSEAYAFFVPESEVYRATSEKFERRDAVKRRRGEKGKLR